MLAIHDEWLAVDKPAGMPTQPPRDRAHHLTRGDPSRRAQEDLARAPSRYADERRRYLRRSARSAARLSQLFASRQIRKTYLARVDPPIREAITIDTPIDGKDAVTIVRPRERDLVEVEIETGRTHQIRRHLSSIGHSVIGDQRYGSTVSAARLMLHAWRIEHDELGRVEAPIPTDFL